MKTKRILQLTLLALVVIFAGAAVSVYAANSKEVKRQADLNLAIAQSEATFNRSLEQKAAKAQEATALTNELNTAMATLDAIDFRASAESIEYDRLLFSLADGSKLQVVGLGASKPVDRKEGGTVYQVTSFTVTVEGKTPGVFFQSSGDSTNYVNNMVKSILDFVNSVVTSADFDTAIIQSVNISAPKPMTNEEVQDMNTRIKDTVKGKLTETETENKTEEEISQLVESKLAAMTADEIQVLMAQAGLEKPSSVITIEIWTYKGA